MKGRRPKDPKVRQRRNKTATAATLPGDRARARRVPPLPAYAETMAATLRSDGRAVDWHAQTRAWWTDVWHSPMAAEFLQADRHALVRLAMLVEAFWWDPSKELAAEIRLQEARFGLTPVDRHRLQWAVEEPKARRRRPHEQEEQSADPAVADPRDHLRVVV